MEKFLFALTIVLIPFDGLNFIPGSSSLGLLNMGYFYPMSLAIVLFCLKETHIIEYDKKIITIILLMMTWGLISLLYHLPIISVSNSFQTEGLIKAISALVMFVFILLINAYIYSMLVKIGKKDIIIFFTKFVLYSYYIVLGFAIIQLGTYYGSTFCRSIWEFIGPFLDIQYSIDRQFMRVYSVSQEPSTFCTYMAFAFPWLLYITRKDFSKKNLLLVISSIVLTLHSQSRLGYVVVLLELVLFLVFFKSKFNLKKKKTYIFIAFIILSVLSWQYATELEDLFDNIATVFMTLDFYNEGRSTSNFTRYGTQIAGIQMFVDNLFIGVGPGQSQFYMEEYLPSWAWLSAEIQGILNNYPMNIYNAHVKILAEYGIVGILCWISLPIYAFVSIFKIYKFEKKYVLREKVSIYIFLSFLGTLISMCNFATIIWFQYWFLINLSSFIKHSIDNSEKRKVL